MRTRLPADVVASGFVIISSPRRAAAPESASPTRREANQRRSVVDDLFGRYLRWREACAALAAAYDKWERAPQADRARAFAAYTAQLGLEEQAAKSYERGTRSAMADEHAELPAAA
jgi:hypothetical protein